MGNFLEDWENEIAENQRMVEEETAILEKRERAYTKQQAKEKIMLTSDNQAKSNYSKPFTELSPENIPSVDGPRGGEPTKRELLLEYLDTLTEPISVPEIEGIIPALKHKAAAMLYQLTENQQVKRRRESDISMWMYWPAGKDWPEDAVIDDRGPEPTGVADVEDYQMPPPPIPPVLTDAMDMKGVPLHSSPSSWAPIPPTEDPVISQIINRKAARFPEAELEARRLRAFAGWDDMHPDISRWLLGLADTVEGLK